MTCVNVEEFKIRIQKNFDFWYQQGTFELEQQLHQKQSNL
jgi:hypothetical protein